ncbi:MAG: S-layer homology domain-containing protein [Vicinamibacterales bacterium]
MNRLRLLLVLVAFGAACARPAPPAMSTAPRYPTVPALDVPVTLTTSAQVRERHAQAWRRFQSGDLRGASRDWQAALQADAAFYPAHAGLGFVAAEQREWADAMDAFGAALAVNADYVPALTGMVDAALSAGEDAEAAMALERLIAATPAGEERETREMRLDVLRLRAVQDALGRAVTARQAGDLDAAQSALDTARRLSPGSPIILRELARLDLARGAFDDAETHAREATTLDQGDAESHAVLGEVLEAQGRLRDAAAAFTAAVKIEARAEWRDRASALSSAADLAALPAEYRALPSASTMSRAQLAALLGIRFQRAVAAAPRRGAQVMTDIRGHWAATWILPVTRAGIMDPLPNHTFQPSGQVRRADLAQVLWQTVQVLAANRRADIAAWRRAAPAASDVPRGHLAAGAISAVMAAGLMSGDENGRFRPTAPATGAEALAAVARLEQIIGGSGGDR